MDNKRKGTNIQTWMSKGLSFLMALLLCVTTVFSVPTVSFAAEGEETAQTATEEQTLPSEGTSVVFKRDSKENENQESTTENGVEANKAESKNAENALKNSVSALQKPQPAGLADGLYKVPLKLKHAYDGERLSMGNGAVIQTATMDVKNGKATLYMQMRGLHFMGMYGHLYNLFQWRSDGNGADPYSFKGKKEPVQVIRTGKDSSLMGELMDFPEILKLTDCDVTKPYVPVCVWVDAMDAIQSGGATSYDQIRQGAGEQSAKLTPDWSKAEKLAVGTDLEAALLQAGIKQYVQDASRDAAKYSAKSYAPYKKALDTLDSLASGELQDANTLFNALQDFKATRHNLVDAKKADLKDLLDQAKQLNAKDYTKESWDALQKAVKDASKTFNKSMANEAEIKNAENELKNAIAALQKPQPAGLADGLYKVPLKLKHAYDGERLSMGNGAVIQTATMDVKNGKATLYMQMRGLHFMGMYGHLYNLFQWRSDGNGADPYSFKGKKEPVQVIRTGKDSSLMGELMEFPEILKLTDCDVTKPYVPVCVWVDAMDAIQSGGATSYDQIRQGAGEQSAKLTPDWSKAEKLAAGTDLEAALLQAGIKQYVHDASRDAAKYSAKSYAPYKKALDTLDSLASGELQDANTLFNALQDFKATRHNLVDAKKADLKDLLDQAKQLNAKDYTKESWDALQKAVKDASKTFNKSMANEAEIKNAENALKNAIAALQKPQPAGLADGLYKVPLKLKHAYDGERLSMGNGAVIQTATMDVKNGKATLYMQMRGLHFMGMYGHLYKLFQWRSDGNGADPYSFKGKKEPVQAIRTGKDSSLMGELMEFPEILKLTDCDVTKPYVPVCVWVDAMDAIQSGGATSYDQIRQGAGEQSAKLTPDWSKAEKLAAGTDLEAALLQAGIKQYVHDASRDAAKYSAKSYAPYKKALDTLDSLASGELQDANTLFNALQDFKATRHNLVDAKKADLKDLLDQAKQLNAKDYTKESWDALQKAVKDASKTFNKSMANEAEIKNAENELKNAIAALQKPQPAGLADGLYKVPLKLKHAYDGERLSMGNGAVIQTATLDVKNGKATLYMQMRGLHFLGMYGHLYNLFQWRSDGNGADPYSFKGKKEPVPVIRMGKDSNLLDELMEFPEILKLTDCDVTKPYVPVCVWVDAMDALQSADTSSYDKIKHGAGEQNAKLTPDWSKAEKLAAGTDLEAVLLQAGIKQYVHDASRDAAKYSAKSYAPYKKALDTLDSLASGELQDANTLFNALQDFKATRHNLVDAKKADLKDLLDQAKQLNAKDYTKESWDALQKAVKDASKTYYKEKANDAEIKNAENVLKNAIAALQKKEDPQKEQALNELQEQLAAIRVLKESDYTPESWKPLALQKEAAEALLKKQNTTAEELHQQVKALKAAVDGLKKAAPKQMPMLDSKDQAPKVWKKNETKSFTCRIIAPMMNLKSVRVDGNELAKENYSVTEGSTIITLKESYLNSLAAGKHTLTVAFKEGNGFAAGTVEQTFEVKDAQPAPNPDQPKPNPNPDQPTPNPNPTPNPGDSKPQRTEIYYEVPVELMHAYEKKHSMGNPALVHMAKVFVTKDGLSYELEFTGMAFMGMYGHLWNLYYRNEPCGAEEWTPAVILEEKNDKDLENKMRKFPSKFRLNCTGEAQKNLPNLKAKSRIHVTVWVDAMDALTNGAKTYNKIVKGSGAQKAYLEFDWSKAVKHESTQPAPNPDQPAPNPSTPKQKPMVDPKGQAPKVWKKNETKSFTCRIIAPMMNLKNVKVDGNELAKDNYTVTEGSTIITLKELYLNSLAAGKHTLAVAFKEGNSYAAGTVEQTFEVKEAQPAPNPNQPKPNPNLTPNQGNTEQRGSGTSHGTQSKPQGNTKGQSNITSKIYNVPVKLMHAYENRPSMGNPALVKTARVICQSNGKTQVILSINGMEFMNMYGHVWNFFHYVGGNPVAAQVMKWHNDKNLIGKLQKFPYQFSLLRSGKESRIKVRVWVDAMDALKNGAKTYDKIQPGSGAQDAYLVLDWSNATLIQETHSAQIAGGKESANPASSRQEGIVTNASNSDDANAQASDNSFDKSESLETGENNVPVDSGNSASQESSQAAKIDTSDSSHITLAAAVLIGGIGILGLMYYFKNRKKA